MKKYSLIISSMLIVTILSLASSSCSRKVGCYSLLNPEIEASRNTGLSPMSLHPSGMRNAKHENTTSLVTNCDQVLSDHQVSHAQIMIYPKDILIQ